MFKPVAPLGNYYERQKRDRKDQKDTVWPRHGLEIFPISLEEDSQSHYGTLKACTPLINSIDNESIIDGFSFFVRVTMDIITTHKNTDFDALASVIAGTLLYPGAVGVIPKAVNKNVEKFLSTHKTAFNIILPHEVDHEAVKRLSTGKGNALSVGERIRSLGVKTKRPMPSMLVEGVSLAAPTEDSEEHGSSESDAKL